MEDWSDRAAVVTGATGGLGRALVAGLAALGCRVVAVARSRAALETFAAEVAADAGVEVVARPGDPATADANRDAVADALRRWGRLDVGASCAGAHLFDIQPDAAASLLRANALTKARLAEATLPTMAKRGRGHVLFVSSMASTVPLAGQSAYCASMAAVDMLARALDAEHRGRGVRVHAYAPGLVDTPLARRQFTEMARAHFAGEGLRPDALAARVERFWREETLSAAEAARDMVGILKSPHDYADAVVPRPPKVVLG